MVKILVTGMSGTGKSTALARLAERGFDAIETDRDPWSEWSEVERGYVWREDRIRALLSERRDRTLYIAGTVSNQGRFYPLFDAVVLLRAPTDVLLGRIATRSTNSYGKNDEERALILRDVTEAEPLLRATCTHEIDATQPVAVVVDALVGIGKALRKQPPRTR